MKQECIDLIEWYRKLGFTNKHVFKGEYTLLLNPDSLQKVRVYFDGRVWMSGDTGEYVKVTKESI